MIAKLTGKIDSRTESSVVVDVNGVGYFLMCSRNTLNDLPIEASACVLFVEPLIRSESIILFGFSREEERSIFRLLLTVQGVGGKVCIAILSVLTPSDIAKSIASQDHVPFTEADGVGPKVAQRIVRELKDKVGQFIGKDLSSGVSLPRSTSSLHQEAISALVNLGYKRQQAVEAVHLVMQEDNSPIPLGQLIPLALKQLAGS